MSLWANLLGEIIPIIPCSLHVSIFFHFYTFFLINWWNGQKAPVITFKSYLILALYRKLMIFKWHLKVCQLNRQWPFSLVTLNLNSNFMNGISLINPKKSLGSLQIISVRTNPIEGTRYLYFECEKKAQLWTFPSPSNKLPMTTK